MRQQYRDIKSYYSTLPNRFNLNIQHSPVCYIYNDYTEEVLGVYSFDRKKQIIYVCDYSPLSRCKYRYISTYELENSGWVFVDKKLRNVLDKLKKYLDEDLPF